MIPFMEPSLNKTIKMKNRLVVARDERWRRGDEYSYKGIT